MPLLKASYLFHADMFRVMEAPNRRSTGSRMRRQTPTYPTVPVKTKIETTMGTKRTPHGVKFRMKPSSGTAAMLRPRDRAKRSVQSSSVFSGKSAAAST